MSDGPDLVPPLTELELGWLAGLMEGEGSFQLNDGSVRCSVAMTDRDVVERAVRCFGPHGTFRGPYVPRKPGHKPVYVGGLYGTAAMELMRQLRPHMGERRKSQIDAVLAGRAHAVARMHKGLPAKCHPERRNRSRGLCAQCYSRKHRAEHPEKYTEYRRRARSRYAADTVRREALNRRRRLKRKETTAAISPSHTASP